MSKKTKIRNPVNTKTNHLVSVRSRYLFSVNTIQEYIEAIKSYHRQPCYSSYRYTLVGGFRVCLNKIKY